MAKKTKPGSAQSDILQQGKGKAKPIAKTKTKQTTAQTAKSPALAEIRHAKDMATRKNMEPCPTTPSAPMSNNAETQDASTPAWLNTPGIVISPSNGEGYVIGMPMPSPSVPKKR